MTRVDELGARLVVSDRDPASARSALRGPLPENTTRRKGGTEERPFQACLDRPTRSCALMRHFGRAMRSGALVCRRHAPRSSDAITRVGRGRYSVERYDHARGWIVPCVRRGFSWKHDAEEGRNGGETFSSLSRSADAIMRVDASLRSSDAITKVLAPLAFPCCGYLGSDPPRRVSEVWWSVSRSMRSIETGPKGLFSLPPFLRVVFLGSERAHDRAGRSRRDVFLGADRAKRARSRRPIETGPRGLFSLPPFLRVVFLGADRAERARSRRSIERGVEFLGSDIERDGRDGPETSVFRKLPTSSR